ncbi:YceI family protein [Ferrovum sp. PN-J185]|uniref:YceI family protein n=1 Tax=Ferrovum sp. PN-J185 TaxID=1356306 RepID=UPI0007974E88|nr:YceI family protein [Ferrovum sp. PN-J185]KXW56649.1 YceI-like domain protein [Ferrovum sp. PN-J185]
MRFLLFVVVFVLSGCGSVNNNTDTSHSSGYQGQGKQEFSAQPYKRWQQSWDHVLWVDATHSTIIISVFKAGTLARIGHDHVVVVHDLKGAIDESKGIGDFSFLLTNMAVDEPYYRQLMHLPPGISKSAREGTRNNMLNKVLFADQYPVVTLHAQILKDNPGYVGLTINLHGVTQKKIIAYQKIKQNGHIHITGEAVLTQTQFGIKPFSVLSGALQVKNQINIQFNIEILEQKINNTIY